MPGVPVAHRGAIEHGVAIGGDAGGRGEAGEIAQLFRRHAGKARHRQCSANHAEGAVRIDDEFDLGRHADARDDFIGERNRGEQLTPRYPALLRDRQRCRNHLHAGMAVGQKITFIKVEPGACDAVEHGGVKWIAGAPGADHPGAARRGGGKLLVTQGHQLARAHAGGVDRQGINQNFFGAREHGSRDVFVRGLAGEACQLVEVVAGRVH